MGSLCASAKAAELPASSAPAPPEENKIIKREKTVPFSTVNCSDAIKSVKTEAGGDLISLPQLKRAFHDLKINTGFLSDPDDPLYAFFMNFKGENRLLNLRQIVVVAILVGKGKTDEKAEWLFRQYDIDASNSLEAEELKQMIHALAHVSIDLLPQLACGEEPDQLTEQQLENYRAPLHNNIEAMVERISSQLLTGEQINSESFKEKLRGPYSQLCSSSGVRMLAALP